jgi:hypothetical protein
MQAAAVIIGSVAMFGGVLSAGAGTAGWRALRRIRDSGIAVWALIAPAPRSPEDAPSGYRPLLRYTTEDGRPLEVFSPSAPTKSRPLVEGRPILVRYDPADPTQIVLHGTRPYADILFIVLGALAAVGAVVFMVLAP